jgi:hypothetical protein
VPVGDLRISVTDSDDDVAELRALYETILDDDVLRSARKSLNPGVPAEGKMGAGETIELVLTNTAAFTAFATCVKAWLDSRRSKLVLKVEGPGGKSEIVADGVNVVTSAALNRAMDIAQGAVGEASR